MRKIYFLLIAMTLMFTGVSMGQVNNEMLFNKSWKLVKMEPKFGMDVEATLYFDNVSKELKIVKQVTSKPELRGTKLVTTKNESLDFYQWSYKVQDATYEGDNVKEEVYDYQIIDLKAEGYSFKIDMLNESTLILEVVKAPKTLFGTSLFDVKKMHFTKI